MPWPGWADEHRTLITAGRRPKCPSGEISRRRPLPESARRCSNRRKGNRRCYKFEEPRTAVNRTKAPVRHTAAPRLRPFRVRSARSRIVPQAVRSRSCLPPSPIQFFGRRQAQPLVILAIFFFGGEPLLPIFLKIGVGHRPYLRRRADRRKKANSNDKNEPVSHCTSPRNHQFYHLSLLANSGIANREATTRR